MSTLTEVEPGLIFPRLSKFGLPKFIPPRDRRAIAGRSFGVIRFWMTLYSIYRILEIPNRLKLSTITDPFSGDVDTLSKVQEWIRLTPGSFLKRQIDISHIKKGDLVGKRLLLSSKSSPSSRQA